MGSGRTPTPGTVTRRDSDPPSQSCPCSDCPSRPAARACVWGGGRRSVWHGPSPRREPGALCPSLGSAAGFPPLSNRRKYLTCAEGVAKRRKHVGPNMVRPLRSTVWPFLRTLKIEPTDDPATPLLGTEPREPKAGSPRDTCTPRPRHGHSQSHRVEAAPRPLTGDGPSTQWTVSRPQNGRRSWHPLHHRRTPRTLCRVERASHKDTRCVVPLTPSSWTKL